MTEDEKSIFHIRSTISEKYLSGYGAEVGAGDRPWPLPKQATAFYGDVRDLTGLELYFKNSNVRINGELDAQTFSGISDNTFDFLISAHVIEHLPNPIGAIYQAMRVIKPSAVFILAVPELTKTFDQLRSPTPLTHLLQDAIDGGEPSRLWSCVEHIKYVHRYLTGETIPDDEVPQHAARLVEAKMDMHWHAWTGDTFLGMLRSIPKIFTIETHESVANENIFVLRKGYCER